MIVVYGGKFPGLAEVLQMPCIENHKKTFWSVKFIFADLHNRRMHVSNIIHCWSF